MCKSVIATFSRSWKKLRNLTTAQQQKGLLIHKLKADVVTRWGSSYEMVKRLIEQMEAVRMDLATDNKKSHLIPSWQDCDVLATIAAALKDLKEMTDALSGEASVTVSAIKPLLKYITAEILILIEGDSELTKERVKVDLEVRYSDPELFQLLEFASFLDSRFKLGYVTDRERVLKEVEEQLSGANDGVTESESASGSDEHTVGEPPAKKPKGLSKISKRIGSGASGIGNGI